jgi:dCMP deaminase
MPTHHSRNKHDKYKRFLPVAQSFAQMSKDQSTRVGALVLGPGFEVRSSGWNGAPRGSKADEDERFERPEKYQWSSHAEMNAIAQAARMGVSLQECSMVVTHPPCMICSRLIVQAGIIRVYAPTPSADFVSRWKEDMDRSARLFKECRVDLVLFDDIDTLEK